MDSVAAAAASRLRPFLLVFAVLPLPSCYGYTSVPTFQCGNPDKSGVTQIDAGRYPAGQLETPDFPHLFPLPVSCVWIFDNSRWRERGENFRRRSGRPHIHVYFTEVSCFPIYLQFDIMRQRSRDDHSSVSVRLRNAGQKSIREN